MEPQALASPPLNNRSPTRRDQGLPPIGSTEGNSRICPLPPRGRVAPALSRCFAGEAGPRTGLALADERLTNRGDRRDVVLHDLVRLRLRLTRRYLLQPAQRILEVAALAFPHGVLGVPEADSSHLAVLGQGTVPGDE